jgi:hypothetical protein
MSNIAFLRAEWSEISEAKPKGEALASQDTREPTIMPR